MLSYITKFLLFPVSYYIFLIFFLSIRVFIYIVSLEEEQYVLIHKWHFNKVSINQSINQNLCMMSRAKRCLKTLSDLPLLRYECWKILKLFDSNSLSIRNSTWSMLHYLKKNHLKQTSNSLKPIGFGFNAFIAMVGAPSPPGTSNSSNFFTSSIDQSNVLGSI